MDTPLYHASLTGGGSAGLAFVLGEAVWFTPWDDERIYAVHDPGTALHSVVRVPPGEAMFLDATILSSRLAKMGHAHDLYPLS
jgi:hypothetical protein